jgi:hypothetical protein
MKRLKNNARLIFKRFVDLRFNAYLFFKIELKEKFMMQLILNHKNY